MEVKIDRVPTKGWARNYLMDYARSVRRHKFGPTDHSPMYFDRARGVVVARTTKEPFELGKSSGIPNFSGVTEVTAKHIQNDLEYVCEVTIGTAGSNGAGETLRLDFDTGSSDMWVWSSNFRASESNKSRNFYDPSKSPTSDLLNNLTWDITYGDRSGASGVVYADNIKIGDLVVQKQAIEVAQHLSSSFLHDSSSDGLLGLGFSNSNTVHIAGNKKNRKPQKTPMQNMVEQGLLKRPIFTAKLDKEDDHGFYTFGYIDEQIATEDQIKWTNVDNLRGYWEFPSSKLVVGNKVIHRAPGNTAIADTGSTLIYVDEKAAVEFYAAIPGSQLHTDVSENPPFSGYMFPTAEADKLGPISFSVGEHSFSIPGKDLISEKVKGLDGWSYGAIAVGEDGYPDILGDVFLKRVYAVFEQTDNPRIGFAQR